MLSCSVNSKLEGYLLHFSKIYSHRMDGKHCEVKCSQDVIDHPPSVGAVITVKHEGCYSTGVLKQPTFWRERRDVQWNSIEIGQQVHFFLVTSLLFDLSKNHFLF